MIDPLKAIIALLKTDPILLALAGSRIATKHQYGTAWPKGVGSVIVRPDGGVPLIYLPVNALRLEIDCYAGGQLTAMALWQQVDRIARATDRTVVETEDGRAVIYTMLPAGAPSLPYDDQVGMDLCMSFYQTTVAIDPVT